MQTLAKLSFEYIWLVLFAEEDVIDFDYSVKVQESLSDYFSTMNEEERNALSRIAKDTKSKLLAEPDEYGYSPRSLITEEQKTFLDALSSGELFEQW